MWTARVFPSLDQLLEEEDVFLRVSKLLGDAKCKESAESGARHRHDTASGLGDQINRSVAVTLRVAPQLRSV
jgi:hypothetical protein